MADKKAEAPVTAEAPKQTYTAAEIAANAPALLGYGVDIARAALDYNNVSECTIDEAKKLIKAFAERKVH